MFLCAGIFTHAQVKTLPVFEITNDTSGIWVLDSTYWQILPDGLQSFTIDKVQHSPLEDSFRFIYSIRRKDLDDASTFWIRFRFRNATQHQVKVALGSGADRADFFLIGKPDGIRHLKTGYSLPAGERSGIKLLNEIPIAIEPGEILTVYYKRSSYKSGLPEGFRVELRNAYDVLEMGIAEYEKRYFSGELFTESFFTGFLLLACVFNFFFFLVAREKVYLHFSLFLLFIGVPDNFYIRQVLSPANHTLRLILSESILLSFFFLIHFVRQYFKTAVSLPRLDKWIQIAAVLLLGNFLLNIFVIADGVDADFVTAVLFMLNMVLVSVAVILVVRKSGSSGKFFLLAIAPFLFCLTSLLLVLVISAILNQGKIFKLDSVLEWVETWGDPISKISLAWAVVVFSWALFSKYNSQRKEIAAQELEKERLAKEAEMERNKLIDAQKIILEEQVVQRTAELNRSLENLKATQAQLIQKEKMASLGELTAGIAHEIQNPLNFVNNFSDINVELIDEMEEELKAGNSEEAMFIASDIRKNLEKISSHGERADAIVKGMLEHSKNNSGEKELCDINKLVEENFALALHSQRGRKKDFEVEFRENFDTRSPKMEIIPQDIGRVLQNLYSNAFYAVSEKAIVTPDYNPEITVTTEKKNGIVAITVRDNGIGIPAPVLDRIFQPFFTTRPTGKGTGLGLSLSYDIIKAHGGEIKVSSIEGEGSEFVVTLNGNG